LADRRLPQRRASGAPIHTRGLFLSDSEKLGPVNRCPAGSLRSRWVRPAALGCPGFAYWQVGV